jgi:putative ABC transport system ATP-binding protein
MITLSQLKFAYGSEFELAIEQLDIEAGERVAIVGPSGSGKTTLLNLLAGILVPKAGTVQIGTNPLSQQSETQRRLFRLQNIGLVFQEFELVEYLSTLDNILLPYRLNKSMILTKEVKQRAGELAKRLEVEDKLHRFPNRLSQGERQRVAICRALINSPSILLTDEPTGNLDPINKMRVLELLMDVVKSDNHTLITVTHDHDLIDHFDRVIDFSLLYQPTNPNLQN